jgi:hypothetical protein
MMSSCPPGSFIATSKLTKLWWSPINHYMISSATEKLRAKSANGPQSPLILRIFQEKNRHHISSPGRFYCRLDITNLQSRSTYRALGHIMQRSLVQRWCRRLSHYRVTFGGQVQVCSSPKLPQVRSKQEQHNRV